MPPPPVPPASRPKHSVKARNAVLINQFATPGLGSLLAGRRLAGAGQLLLAVAGFCFVIAWFGFLMVNLYRQLDTGEEAKSVGWIGETGAALFGVAWTWALFTSFSLLRHDREEALRDLTKGEPSPPERPG